MREFVRERSQFSVVPTHNPDEHYKVKVVTKVVFRYNAEPQTMEILYMLKREANTDQFPRNNVHQSDLATAFAPFRLILCKTTSSPANIVLLGTSMNTELSSRCSTVCPDCNETLYCTIFLLPTNRSGMCCPHATHQRHVPPQKDPCCCSD